MTVEEKVNSEVLAILMILGNEYTSKIPDKIMEYLIYTSNLKNLPNIDPNKRIEEQNISEEARTFLVMLKLRYWCKTDEEKKELLKILDDNEKVMQANNNSISNLNNLMDNSNENIVNEEIRLPQNQTIITKIYNRIKALFK